MLANATHRASGLFGAGEPRRPVREVVTRRLDVSAAHLLRLSRSPTGRRVPRPSPRAQQQSTTASNGGGGRRPGAGRHRRVPPRSPRAQQQSTTASNGGGGRRPSAGRPTSAHREKELYFLEE
uniref:Uncharacterized protein n=1 Tax=Zea mays TaxID=4577 RepID=A0A804P1B5_MAIZE